MVTILYRGGPRDGTQEERERDPLVIGCVEEAAAKGMHGVYRTDGSVGNRVTEGTIVAHWKDIPKPNVPPQCS